VLHPLKKLPALYGIRKFTNVFTRARHLCQMNPTHAFPSHFFKFQFNFILRSRSMSAKWISYSVFPTKTPYVFNSSPIHATRPSNLTLLKLITRIIFDKSTSHEAFHYATFSSIPLLPRS